MNIDTTWLEEHVFHHVLTGAEQRTLRDLVEVHHYGKGESLIVEQSMVNGLLVLKEGSVALRHEQHGQKVQIARLEAGVQLGDMSLFGGGCASASVVALTDCVVYQLPQSALQYMMQYRQNMVQDIMRNSIRNLSAALRRMNDHQAYALQYMQGVHASC